MAMIWANKNPFSQRGEENERGFSLLELLVAVVVLGISLLGLAQLVGIAIQQNSEARVNTIGIEVARGKLEQLRAAYSWQMESGEPASELAAGLHGPEIVELPRVSEQFGVRRVLLQWTVTDQTVFRKDVEILVRPQVSSNQTDETWSALRKSTRITTSLTP